MNECLGQFYFRNNNQTESVNFNNSFINGPDYVYEVFRVIEGIPLFIEDHFERLQHTCILADYPLNLEFADFKNIVAELIKQNHLAEGNIKVVMRKLPQGDFDFLIYINEHQYPSAEQFEKGVDLALFRGIRYTPNAKIMDVILRTENNLLKANKGVYETLLVDEKGCITEGSRSNVFFIRNDRLITPPVEDVLPGVTRKNIITVCANAGIEVVEERVLARSVIIMEGVFISGTSRKVLPVKSIDGVEFDAAHPMIVRIKSLFNQRVADYLSNNRL